MIFFISVLISNLFNLIIWSSITSISFIAIDDLMISNRLSISILSSDLFVLTVFSDDKNTSCIIFFILLNPDYAIEKVHSWLFYNYRL